MKKNWTFTVIIGAIVLLIATVFGGHAAGIWNRGDHTIEAIWHFPSPGEIEIENGGYINVENGGYISFDSGGTLTLTNATITGTGTITQTHIADKVWRIPVPLASVFVDGTGPITSSSAPNLTTVDNVGAIVYDNSGETAEIQFPWVPDTNFTAMSVKVLATSADSSAADNALDWSIFSHADNQTTATVVAQTGASFDSATFDASEDMVTLTLDATGIAAVTAGTSAVTIAIWNNSTDENTLEIKSIWIEETR